MEDEEECLHSWDVSAKVDVAGNAEDDAGHDEECAVPCREHVHRVVLEHDDLDQSSSKEDSDSVTSLPS